MASINTTYLKSNWWQFVIIGLVLFIMFAPESCGNRFGRSKDGPDTVRVESRVEYRDQPPVYLPMYTPGQSGATVYVPTPSGYQPTVPAGTIEELVKQVQELSKSRQDLANEYFAIKNYKDSIQLKDSAGKRVGVVNLNDVVSENQIKSRTPSYQLSFPHTITDYTIAQEPKRQLYLGGGITGNTVYPVNGANLGIIYKNKKEKLFGASAGVQSYNGQVVPQFEISTYWKLSLKK